MHVLTEKEFRNRKRSDTIVVYGSGYSVNKLDEADRAELSQYDSIGFNWFCFSRIPTTFYVVREQANIPSRVHRRTGETVDNFVQIINHEPYNKSCLIVHDLTKHSRRIHHYHTAKALARFNHDGVVAKDVKLPLHKTGIKQWSKKSIFESGVYHGVCTLTNVLHIVVNLGYERIFFSGVDLHDSRYFWLRKRKTRDAVKQKGKNYRSLHTTALPVIEMIKGMKKHHKDVKMYVFKHNSMLNKMIPVWGK